MNYYKLVISYKGTHYFGWQLQPEASKPSVEGAILLALKKICRQTRYELSGASRTDAGVHATGQVARVALELPIDAKKLELGLNSELPRDIRVISCTCSDQKFNATNFAKTKLYHYNFSMEAIENPITSDFVFHAKKELNIELMNKAAILFIGKHDFYNFCSRSTMAKTTIREISKCEIIKYHTSFPGGCIYTLQVEGSGFLKQMIRYIAGALFAIGAEEIKLEKIKEYLFEHREDKLSAKAASKGLCLISMQ